MEKNNVLVLTSNSTGGIAQFAFFLAKGIKDYEQVDDVVFMVPRDSEYSASSKMQIDFYGKVDSLRGSEKKFEAILSKIEKHQPTHIIFTELSLANMQLAEFLKGRYHLTVVLHDALSRLTRFDFMQLVQEKVFQRTLDKSIHYFDEIVVLSNAVLEELNERFNINQDKILRMHLCSHLHVTPNIPLGNMIGEDYFLFFGRIEKFKGLQTLFEAYEKDLNHLLPKLVVAGKGQFTKKEQEILGRIKHKVVVINKYITDESLASLMTFATAVILPFTEATQSGIVPMAYSFKKPVVISDLPALKESIVEGDTGYSFPVGNSTDLYTVLKKLVVGSDDIERMEPLIEQYYEDNYNWQDNIFGVLDGIFK